MGALWETIHLETTVKGFESISLSFSHLNGPFLFAPSHQDLLKIGLCIAAQGVLELAIIQRAIQGGVASSLGPSLHDVKTTRQSGSLWARMCSQHLLEWL